MAASALTVTDLSRAGYSHTAGKAAANVDGNYWANDGRIFLAVTNGSGGSITVTLVWGASGVTVDGQTPTQRTVAIAAGATTFIGPFPTATYNDATGNANVTYSAVTSVTVSACRLTA